MLSREVDLWPALNDVCERQKADFTICELTAVMSLLSWISAVMHLLSNSEGDVLSVD